MFKDEEVWKAAHVVIDRIADDRRSGSAPIVSIVSTEEAIEIARGAAPGSPRALSEVIDEAVRIFSHRVRMDHPRFCGFIPSPASPLSFVGDMMTSGFNAHAGSWMQSSGPSAIEQGLIAWWAQRAGAFRRKPGVFVSRLWRLVVRRSSMRAL